MAISNIPSEGNWGDVASKINNNFQSVSIDLEKTKNASIRSKGLFPTAEALSAAFPNPKQGDWAVVGNTIPGLVYVCNTSGTWTNTGAEGGGGEVDLAAYLTFQDLGEI